MQKQKQNLKVSDHIYSVVQNHFKEAEIQNSLIESYYKARPKSYPVVFRQLFVLSKYSRQLFHIFSLLIALSFGFNLVSWLMSAMGVPAVHYIIPLTVAILILGLFERFQDVCLDIYFTMYFQTKKHSPTLLTLSGFFSIISIVSSVYSAKELSSFSSYSYAFIALSFIVELMIIGTSYFIHSYHHRSALTVNLISDLYSQQNEVVTANNSRQIKSDIEAPKQAKKVSSILFTNSVQTADAAKKAEVKVWKKEDIKNNRTKYKERLKAKETLSRKVGYYFFDSLYQNWSNLQQNNVVPVIPQNVRKEFYKTKNIDTIKDYIDSIK